MMGVTLFTTLFPDIDLRISKIRNLVAILAAFFISIIYTYFFTDTWYYSPVYFVILYILVKIIPTKHRGVAHTIKFSIIFSAGMLLMLNFFLRLNQTENVFWFFVIFLSYNLHLFLDRI